MPEPYLGGLRLEEFLVLRHKVTNACCGPSGDLLDILCKTVIAIRGMETGHGQEMFIEMLRQITLTQLPVAPLIERHIDLRNRSSQCSGVFRRDAAHVLRPRPGQFVNLANMTGRTCQDGRNHFRHIFGIDW